MFSRKRILFVVLTVLCVRMVARADNRPGLNVSADSLIFRQLTSTPPPSQTVVVSAKGGLTLGAFTATATPTGSWLSVNPGSGTGTATLTVSVNTTGLKPGEYSGSIAVSAPALAATPVLATATIKVQLEIFTNPGQPTPPPGTTPTSILILRPDDLQFHATAGGPVPDSHTVAIFNPAGDNFSWTAAVTVTTPMGGKWLAVSPASSTGKAMLKVTVDQTGLAAGQFTGKITVTSGSSSATTNVELDVSAGPAAKLVVTPKALNFNIDPNSSKPPEPRTLDVRTTGSDDSHGESHNASLSWTATASVDKPTGGTWLTIAPTSGKSPSKITVKLSATGLAAGSYSGKVTVTTGTGPAATSTSVQVFLRVLGPAKVSVVVTPRELRFFATTGASGVVSPASRTIKISSTSTGFSFTAAATTAKGGAWLKRASSSGSVPGSVAASVDASIATKLTAGFYTGAVQVTVKGAQKEVNTVHVGLRVFGPNDKPRLGVEPGGVSVKATLGGSDPASQSVTLLPEGIASLAWTAATSVASPAGGSWLSISPSSGTTTASVPSTVAITTKIAGLAAGTYLGTVVFTPDPASGAPVVHLRVVLIVAAAGAGKTGLLVTGDTSGAAVASGELVAYFTSPPDGFISDLAVPPDVQVTVLDSAGVVVEGATVTINSSNGEPDMVLDEVGGGQYEGTFRALVSGSLTLTGAVQLGDQASAAFGISGDVETSADQPTIIFQGGAVSAASFAASPSPLAPGSLVSLFGQNMVGEGGFSSSIPLSTSLGGVTVTTATIGGFAAPLLTADPNSQQINLQVPFELDGQAQAEIVVNNNGVMSQPETIQIASAPALFTFSNTGVGAGAFLHGDSFAAISASSPATAKEVIVLYATGLGAVSPAVATGDATSGQSNVTGNIGVTIGGQPAQVQFAGLAPNFVGLYQINVVVPAGLPSGNALVVLSVDGTPATGQATVALQ